LEVVNQFLPEAADVFVVGGGPAGLAAAIAARQRGFRVVVADGGQPPIDKPCGEGLLPDSVSALERLGIQIPLEESRRFRGIRFLSAHHRADALFRGAECGLAVRRTSLHRVMLERAEQLGVVLEWRTPVTGISRNGVWLSGDFVRTRWIVGADGANSRVRKWAGLERGPRPRLRYAFRQHFRAASWTDHMEVYWGDTCQGYATAVGPDQVCVALASHDPRVRLEEGMRALPALGHRLRGAEVTSAERGSVTGNRQFHRIWRDNLALIGDASGTVDAITGQGLGLAFSQAVALASALECGNLGRYQRDHQRLAFRPRCMARLMLTLDRRPRLQARTLQVFERRPEIFRRLVEFHVGSLTPFHLVKDGLALGWGLFTTDL
jgi:flavin-dependent dehydrogenase